MTGPERSAAWPKRNPGKLCSEKTRSGLMSANFGSASTPAAPAPFRRLEHQDRSALGGPLLRQAPSGLSCARHAHTDAPCPQSPSDIQSRRSPRSAARRARPAPSPSTQAHCPHRSPPPRARQGPISPHPASSRPATERLFPPPPSPRPNFRPPDHALINGTPLGVIRYADAGYDESFEEIAAKDSFEGVRAELPRCTLRAGAIASHGATRHLMLILNGEGSASQYMLGLMIRKRRGRSPDHT